MSKQDEYIAELVREALEEDQRIGDGSNFSRDGWGNFFLEDWECDPEAVEAAWRIYNGAKDDVLRDWQR